jgi:hypothetical protein
MARPDIVAAVVLGKPLEARSGKRTIWIVEASVGDIN